jgi:hypothetical protein
MKDKNTKVGDAARFLDNLTSFLTEDSIRGEHVAEGLSASGIDPEGLAGDLRDILSKHAPTWMQKAQRERLSALDALSKGNALSRPRREVERAIQDLIQAMLDLGAPVVAGAYHQKFQEATDADLESLMQDLSAQYEVLKDKKRNEQR